MKMATFPMWCPRCGAPAVEIYLNDDGRGWFHGRCYACRYYYSDIDSGYPHVVSGASDEFYVARRPETEAEFRQWAAELRARWPQVNDQFFKNSEMCWRRKPAPGGPTPGRRPR
jgi:hypothetical protein